MADQPVPTVTLADVERVVRRDFPEARRAEALAILDDQDPRDPLGPRVHLAVLKLAAGDLAKLKEFMDIAQRDFRDVLAWAEYPEYFREVHDTHGHPDIDGIIERDWRQYDDWLRR